MGIYCIVRFDCQKEVITYFAFYNGGIICCRGKSSFHIRIYFLSMGYLMLDYCVVPWQTYPNSWNCSWFQSSINRFKWGFISLPPLRVKFAKFFWQTKQISWHAVPTRTVRMVATCCNKKNASLLCRNGGTMDTWSHLGGWIVSNFAHVLALAWSWCQYIEYSNDCSVDSGDLGVPANMVYHGLPVFPRVAISCNFSGENHDEPTNCGVPNFQTPISSSRNPAEALVPGYPVALRQLLPAGRHCGTTPESACRWRRRGGFWVGRISLGSSRDLRFQLMVAGVQYSSSTVLVPRMKCHYLCHCCLYIYIYIHTWC